MRAMRADYEWPPLEAFFSHLNDRLTCNEEQWRQARAEFYRRRALPIEDPEHFRSMADYLRVSVCVTFCVLHFLGL